MGKKQEAPVIPEIPIEDLKKYSLNPDGNEDKELGKYDHLNATHDPEKIKFYTEWKDQEEIYRANKIEILCDWAPNIFGKTKGVIAACDAMRKHISQHQDHMVSHKRQGRREAVFAVRPDLEKMPTAKALEKSFLGR